MEVAVVYADAVIACDGVSSTVRRLAPNEPKIEDLFINQERSVWSGVNTNMNLFGKAAFYKGDGDKGGALHTVAVIFPAGLAGGVSWTVSLILMFRNRLYAYLYGYINPSIHLSINPSIHPSIHI